MSFSKSITAIGVCRVFKSNTLNFVLKFMALRRLTKNCSEGRLDLERLILGCAFATDSVLFREVLRCTRRCENSTVDFFSVLVSEDIWHRGIQCTAPSQCENE